MDSWRSRYLQYLQSPEWSALRLTAIEQTGGKCQRCGYIGGLEVHHLHYRTLGRESQRDVLVVCKPCHEKEDELRANRGRSRSMQARFEGWLKRRYPNNWEDWTDDEQTFDQFQDWLEDQY